MRPMAIGVSSKRTNALTWCAELIGGAVVADTGPVGHRNGVPIAHRLDDLLIHLQFDGVGDVPRLPDKIVRVVPVTWRAIG